MAYVEPFDIKKHMPIILDWLEKRGAYRPSPSEMPKIGWVAYEDKSTPKEHPVAAGFLRLVEGGYAQFDGLVSNPEAKSGSRHRCIDLVANQVLRSAKKLGIHQVIFTSVDEGTIERSKRYEFVKLPQTVYVLSLKSGVF